MVIFLLLSVLLFELNSRSMWKLYFMRILMPREDQRNIGCVLVYGNVLPLLKLTDSLLDPVIRLVRFSLCLGGLLWLEEARLGCQVRHCHLSKGLRICSNRLKAVVHLARVRRSVVHRIGTKLDVL